MNNIFKKLAIFLLLILSVQTFMFSESEDEDYDDPETMNLVLLNKEVIAIKFEIFQIDHKFGKYEEMNAIKAKIQKTKLEKKLKKYEPVLKRRNNENKEEAKIAAAKAYEEMKPKIKPMAEKTISAGKELGNKLTNFLKTLVDEE